MTADVSDGEITALYERAVIPSTALDSGYRDVRIADLSGDGSADLIATTLNEVTVVCGHANLFDSGFGFADNVRREDATVGISQAFSLSLGQFDGRGGLDAIIGGGLRASSDVAGIKLFPSEECGFVMNPKEALITGPTTGARFLIVKTGDLNFDGFDDALVLHRETRILELHLGSGGDLLAQGPSIALPAGANGELGLYIEHPGEGQVAVAATTTPAENTVHVVRIRPAPRAQ
jgi:hypothetical protein